MSMFYWANVCKTVRPILSDLCLSCPVLSVCNVGALWPNGSTDPDETWHRGRPRTRPHFVRWGPSFPPPKRTQSPILGPHLLWPNDWMDQDATWYGGRPRPRPRCVRWGPNSPPTERGTSVPPLFGLCLLWPNDRVAQLNNC